MNNLLAEMKRSMEELQLGLDGALNMSAPMEALAAAFAAGRVPVGWMAAMSSRVQVQMLGTGWRGLGGEGRHGARNVEGRGSHGC